MKRIAATAGLAGFALGFGLATAGLPPRAGVQPRLERTSGGGGDAAATQAEPATGGGARRG